MGNELHYKTLNQLIDRLIKKNGAEKACVILQEVMSSTSPVEKGKNDMVINNFIINEWIDVFGLNYNKLKNGGPGQYKKEKWSVFYFVKKHTALSYSWLAEYWSLESIRPLRYALAMIDQLLSNPKIDKEQYALHVKLQERVEAFINANR